MFSHKHKKLRLQKSNNKKSLYLNTTIILCYCKKTKKNGRRKGDSRRRNSALAFQIREASSLGFRSSSRTASPKSRGAASSVFSRLLLLSLRGGEEQRRHRNTQQTSAAALLLHTFFVQQTDRDLSPSAKPTNERANPSQKHVISLSPRAPAAAARGATRAVV